MMKVCFSACAAERGAMTVAKTATANKERMGLLDRNEAKTMAAERLRRR
jgi:hypothetical protein